MAQDGERRGGERVATEGSLVGKVKSKSPYEDEPPQQGGSHRRRHDRPPAVEKVTISTGVGTQARQTKAQTVQTTESPAAASPMRSPQEEQIDHLQQEVDLLKAGYSQELSYSTALQHKLARLGAKADAVLQGVE